MNKVATFYKVSRKQFYDDLTSVVDMDKVHDDQKSEGFYDNVKIPVRATTGSAGHDFVSPIGFELKPGESITIPTGIRCEIDGGWVLMIYPRSSLGFKYRLQLDNQTGIIDADYAFAKNEGHIMAKMTNCGRKIVVIKAGDRVAQGVFLQYGVADEEEVSGERIGGLGSSGK